MTATEISARVDRKENALRAVAAASESVIAAKTDLEFIKTRLTLAGLEGTNDKQRQADLMAKTESELDLADLRVQEAAMLLKVVSGAG